MIRIKTVIDAIVRCRTAALGGHRISVCAVDIRPSPITNAATGTVPSARATHAPSGWPHVPPNCCPYPTSTSSSLCRTSYPRSCFRTSVAALRSALPHQRCNDVRTGSRSEGPGCRHRIPRRAPYLGRIFLTAVWALDLKALVSDVFAKASGCDETPSPAAHYKLFSFTRFSFQVPARGYRSDDQRMWLPVAYLTSLNVVLVK
jgi:hypothetical protein